MKCEFNRISYINENAFRARCVQRIRCSLRFVQMIFSATKISGRETDVHIESELRIIARTQRQHTVFILLFFKRKKVRKHAPRPDCQMLIRMGCCISATTTYEKYGISIQCDVCCAASIHLVHSPNRSFFIHSCGVRCCFFFGRTFQKMFAFFHRFYVDEKCICASRRRL